MHGDRLDAVFLALAMKNIAHGLLHAAQLVKLVVQEEMVLEPPIALEACGIALFVEGEVPLELFPVVVHIAAHAERAPQEAGQRLDFFRADDAWVVVDSQAVAEVEVIERSLDLLGLGLRGRVPLEEATKIFNCCRRRPQVVLGVVQLADHGHQQFAAFLVHELAEALDPRERVGSQLSDETDRIRLDGADLVGGALRLDLVVRLDAFIDVALHVQ